MRKNKAYFIALILLCMGIVFVLKLRQESSSEEFSTQEINPAIGDISITFSTTGVIEPQNRLEIKPPISGRIEEILVQEGDKVKQGQILALMSSTERAALLDSARAQGEEAVKYWKDVYKATPLISPIDGEVIVRAVEPGQTITSTDAVIVLSDRLIVSAQFDETDIGRVQLQQKAIISLDAYPERKIQGLVGHIAYESELVNNVTIYEVDIIPQEIPQFFRSGMSATVEIIEKEKEGVMLLPLAAIINEQDRHFVFAKKEKSNKHEKTEVVTGLSDGAMVEIISGLKAGDSVLVEQKKYALPKKDFSGSPFMPGGSRRR
ncbi:MAG: efflux RND transporter periplasmic adaptor subunit [Candidatus Omnitrophica bacterium]|nr:efflux RND transporter periplasmic adaptor subunit [Candidatus Omnitrophota bacterium]